MLGILFYFRATSTTEVAIRTININLNILVRKEILNRF